MRFSIRSEAALSICEPEGPDGGWGWFVVLASFICLCVLDGAGYTFGIFLDPLLVEMGGKRWSMSLAGSLLVATYAFTGPLAACLVDKFGTRVVCIAGAFISALGLGIGSLSKNLTHIYATYSLLTGVGFGLMYLPAIVSVANHFTKNRSLAIGICLCGAGVGTFALAPLETAITDSYGWRYGFLSLASMALLCVLCGGVMTPVEREEWNPVQPEDLIEPGPSTERKWYMWVFGLSLGSHPALLLYLLVVAGDVAATTCLFIPFQHIPALVRARGLDKDQAAYVISCIGICSTFGRIAAGWMSDRGLAHPLTLITFCVCSVLPPLFLLTGCHHFLSFMLCAGLFGLLTGGWVALMSPLFVRILGLPLLTPAFGLLTFFRGLAALVGPPMAGYAVDYFQDRSAAVVLGGLWMSLAAFLFFVANCYSARRDNRAGILVTEHTVLTT